MDHKDAGVCQPLMFEVKGYIVAVSPKVADVSVALQREQKNSCKGFPNWFLRYNANSLNRFK